MSVLPLLGIRFSLTLAGAYWAAEGRQQPLELRLAAETAGRRITSLRRRLGTLALSGEADMADLPKPLLARGTLLLGTVFRYELGLEGDGEGGSWHLSAEQRLTRAGGPAGFTVVRGALRGPHVVAPSELRFDPRGDLRHLLASLALHRS